VLIDAAGSLTLDESGLMLEAAPAGAGLGDIGQSSAADHIAVPVDWTQPYPGLTLNFAARRHIHARPTSTNTRSSWLLPIALRSPRIVP
jgi:hypothetical protein